MNNILKKRIMRRVYIVYALRKMLSRTAFKLYASLVLLFGIARLLHVRAIGENISEVGFAGLYNFAFYSIMNTELAVQFLMFGVAAFGVWVMRDAVKNILTHTMYSSMQKIR